MQLYSRSILHESIDREWNSRNFRTKDNTEVLEEYASVIA
jgi:hypothetical protein